MPACNLKLQLSTKAWAQGYSENKYSLNNQLNLMDFVQIMVPFELPQGYESFFGGKCASALFPGLSIKITNDFNRDML